MTNKKKAEKVVVNNGGIFYFLRKDKLVGKMPLSTLLIALSSEPVKYK